MKSIVVLSVEDFSISTSVLNPLTNSMMDISILKGKLSVKDSVMTQEIREFKVVDFPENGIPNFSLVTYKEGTPEFDKYLMDKHMDKIVVSVYSVSGNHITLKTDDNKDGDFLDEGEIVTLTKK